MTRYRELIWAFKTARFDVRFYAEDDPYLELSWDEDGFMAEGLASGDFVAFCACVEISFDGCVIVNDCFGACIYRSTEEFCTGHRDPDPMNRNCSRNPRNIGHYFPDIIRTAIAEARAELTRSRPYIRQVAA